MNLQLAPRINVMPDIPVTAGATSDPILRTEHLSRAVKDKVLVEDATFEVRAGEVLAIVGPSGSGKSSLLRLLNRLDEPTSGTVYVEGIDYRQIAPRESAAQAGLGEPAALSFSGHRRREPPIWSAAAW